ncbi:alginate O-acetyltransferase AlgF (plasmid) [Loktanella salsilacus]|uniref:alginate O-acetyltransferase AlgF n=1 Tax=Loktanella salsilacus TaxID=195913 RepID=UPI0020B7CD38|nr:alginate O-acetyltransferase AlgF [Loktanella salsilacus]UTH50083.1 alginate O-acetyltransferase AlgF [Loktanella salsilacus]
MMSFRSVFMAIALPAAAALIASVPGTARSADDALYEDVYDPNSSFIRVLAPAEAFATIDGKTVRDFHAGLSDYVNVMPGTVAVMLSGQSIEIPVAPSKHYTIVSLNGTDPDVIEDMLALSPAKADVSVYNLTEVSGIDLYVPLANAVAIESVDAAHTKSVALKAPLTLDFDLRSGEEELANVDAVDLKRKGGVTIVLSEEGGSFSASAVPNTYFK